MINIEINKLSDCYSIVVETDYFNDCWEFTSITELRDLQKDLQDALNSVTYYVDKELEKE